MPSVLWCMKVVAVHSISSGIFFVLDHCITLTALLPALQRLTARAFVFISRRLRHAVLQVPFDRVCTTPCAMQHEDERPVMELLALFSQGGSGCHSDVNQLVRG